MKWNVMNIKRIKQNLCAVLLLTVLPALKTSAEPSRAAHALVPGKSGQAVNLATGSRTVEVAIPGVLAKRPVTFSCRVKINSIDQFNIIMSVAPKSGNHWELFTAPGNGVLSVFIPGLGGFSSAAQLKPGVWHDLAFRIDRKGFELYADGKQVLVHTAGQDLVFDEQPLILGGVMSEATLHCDGAVDELVISRRTDGLDKPVPGATAQPDPFVLAAFHFDTVNSNDISPNAVSAASPVQARIKDDFSMPVGNRFLDEVEDDARNRSTLHGDASVETESLLPAHPVEAKSSGTTIKAADEPSISLNGEWLLKEGTARDPATLDKQRIDVKESEGTAAGWFKELADRSAWRRVQVPTTVQSALLKSGEIPDPFYDANTWDDLQKNGVPSGMPVQWRQTRIERSEWWFARQFELPDSWKGRNIRLAFDGLDYAGSVFLNGELLGYHAGMFGGPELDISKAVRFGETNNLVVRIDRAADTWHGLLKGSPGWGWHYGHMISLGIWRSVKVEQVSEVKVSDPYVRTQSIGNGKAVLLVQYDVVNNSPDTRQFEVRGTIEGKNFTASPVNFVNRLSVPNGRSRWQTEVTVKKPELWWPLNYGDQNLYELRLADGGAQARTVFGIRTIELLPLHGTKAEQDYRWQFVVNGVPMFIKGANWCWSDPMLQGDPAKYEHLLELARRAGVQMFRAWGGGIIETDEFYRQCDEKGLMVYQEFPFCWGPPTFPMTDAAVLDQQVSRVVKRLRNHPALVMWGGGNENVSKVGADEGLFLVGRRCRQFDPSRLFHRTDPWGGSVHHWGIYHEGESIDKGVMTRPSPFYGEFGLPSMPNLSECLKFLPEEKLGVWPPKQDDGGVMAHMNQFSYGDMIRTMRYADYGPIKSWNDYIEYSQMAQGDEISFVANVQRAGSYFNKGGLWFYKLTDLFPGHSWAVVGFYGQPKLSYYRAKQFYAPQAAFACSEKYDWQPGEQFRASLHVNNDSGHVLTSAVARAVIYGSDLSELWSREYKVQDLGVSSRVDLDPVDVQLPADKIKPFLLAVSLRDASGRQLSDQWQWFNFRAKTADVLEVEKIIGQGWPHNRAPEGFKAYGELPEARLLTLPRTKLSASIHRDGKHGTITVRNETARPAFNVIIDGFPSGYGDFLDDNSFCLYPKEERTIGFEFASLDTSLNSVRIRAWNADSVAPAEPQLKK